MLGAFVPLVQQDLGPFQNLVGPSRAIALLAASDVSLDAADAENLAAADQPSLAGGFASALASASVVVDSFTGSMDFAVVQGLARKLSVQLLEPPTYNQAQGMPAVLANKTVVATLTRVRPDGVHYADSIFTWPMTIDDANNGVCSYQLLTADFQKLTTGSTWDMRFDVTPPTSFNATGRYPNDGFSKLIVQEAA